MTVRDFLLDADGDLAVVNGDFAFVEDFAAVRQAIEASLRLVLGEYFIDETRGTDWAGKILGKGRNELVIREELRRRIARVPDVLDVTSAAYVIDPTTRAGSIRYEVRTTYNRSVRGSITTPT